MVIAIDTFEVIIAPVASDAGLFEASVVDGARTIRAPLRAAREWAEWAGALARRADATDDTQTDDGHALRLGEALFEALFAGAIGAAWRAACARTDRRVRLALRLGAPALHALPWEYLHDGRAFLVTDPHTPVLRTVEAPTPPGELVVRAGLRMLVVISNPKAAARRLDVERERAALESSLAPLIELGLLTIEFIDGQWETLQATLRPGAGQRAFHLLHFIGHGDFGALVFTDPTGNLALKQDAESVAALLRTHPSLRLVVLNACRTSATSSDADNLALILTQRAVPAVVAMQFTISEKAALAFSETFYRLLALGNPVDTAVTLARVEHYARMLRGGRRGRAPRLAGPELTTLARPSAGRAPESRGIEWGTPTLYQRTGVGELFDLRDAQDQRIRPMVSRLPPGMLPYRGLAFFEEQHAQLFLGRDEAVETLTGLLDAPTPADRRLIAVIAGSGSGKSSLVRAGLLPEARAAGWRVALCTPGVDGVAALSAALDQALPPGPPVAAAAGSVEVIRARLPRDAPGLVVVVDQFEEVFTLGDEATHRPFIEALLAAVAATDLPLRVVLALRADFTGHFLRVAGLGGVLARAALYLEPMAPAQLRQVIEVPATLAGYRFQQGLVDELIDEVRGQPQALPLLAFTLDRLWAARDETLGLLRWEHYQALGGLRGAISSYAEAVVAGLPAEHLGTVRDLFLHLVRPGQGVEDTQQPVAKADLERLPDGARVLEVLVDAKLLVTDRAQVHVIHEALIREWSRLQGWIEAQRRGLVLRQQIQQAALLWAASDESAEATWRGANLQRAVELEAERQPPLTALQARFVEASQAASLAEARARIRRRRWLLGALIAGLVLATGAAIVGFHLFVEAEEARQNEEIALLKMKAERDAKEVAREREESAKKAALAAKDEAIRAGHAEKNALRETLKSQEKAIEAEKARGRAEAARGRARQEALEAEARAHRAQLQEQAARVAAIEAAAREQAAREAERAADHLARIREYDALAERLAADASFVAGEGGAVDELALLLASLAWRYARRTEALSGAPSPARDQVDRALRRALASDTFTATVFRATGAVYALAASDSTRRLALATRTEGASLRVVDLDRPSHVVDLPTDEPIVTLDWTPDGATLLAGGNAATVGLWRPDGPPGPIWRGTLASAGRVVAVAASDAYLVAGGCLGDDCRPFLEGHSGHVNVWRRAEGADPVFVGELRTPSPVIGVALVPAPDRVVALSASGSLCAWRLADLRDASRCARIDVPTTGPVPSVDGRHLAFGNRRGEVLIVDSETLAVHARGSLGKAPVAAVGFAPTGIVAASESATLRWRTRALEGAPVPLARSGPGVRFSTLAVEADGALLLAGDDGRVRRLRATTVPVEPTLIWRSPSPDPPQALVPRAAWVPDGPIYHTTPDGAVVRWSPASGAAPLGEPRGYQSALAVDPGGAWVVTADDGARRLHAWRSPTGSQTTISGHAQHKATFGLAVAGDTLLSISRDRTVRQTPLSAHGLEASQLLATVPESAHAIAAWGSDLVAWGLSDAQGTIQIARRRHQGWQLDAGWQRVHGAAVSAVAFGPGRLATGGADGQVRIWPLEGDAPATLGPRHWAGITALAWHPGTDRLASAGADGRIELRWMTPSAAAEMTPNQLRVQARTLAFSADGARLLTSAPDAVAVYTLSTDALARRACAAAGRELTDEEWRQRARGPRMRVCVDADWDDDVPRGAARTGASPTRRPGPGPAW